MNPVRLPFLSQCNKCGAPVPAWHEHSCEANSAGHPLSCSIWTEQVCSCVAQDAAAPVGREPTSLDAGVVASCASTDDVPKACYFCGRPAEWSVYHVGIPSCTECSRRAESLRRRRHGDR